jgi:hypothetical protein
MSRPDSKNVFYFPHYTKSKRELDLIEHKYNSEGYKAYYRLQEMVADADYHRLSLATQDEKDMFDLGMNCKQEVVDDVIRILLDKGRIDRALWENESVIWMQDFVETLKPVYLNRRKPLPDKNIVTTINNTISTGSNTEKRKEKEIKEKEREGKKTKVDEGSRLHPLTNKDVEELKKVYNNVDVDHSYKRYMNNKKESGRVPTRDGFELWLDGDVKNGFNLLPDKPKKYNFVCPVEGCDTAQSTTSKNLLKWCKEHEDSPKELIIK